MRTYAGDFPVSYWLPGTAVMDERWDGILQGQTGVSATAFVVAPASLPDPFRMAAACGQSQPSLCRISI